MDLYNITTKIPYILMLTVGIMLVLHVYVGGLQDVSIKLNDSSETEYDQALEAERMLNLGDERGFLPLEDFQNDNCYFEEFQHLDGEYLKYSIESDKDLEEHGVGCIGTISPDQAYRVPVILTDENLRIPAKVYIYEAD